MPAKGGPPAWFLALLASTLLGGAYLSVDWDFVDRLAVRSRSMHQAFVAGVACGLSMLVSSWFWGVGTGFVGALARPRVRRTVACLFCGVTTWAAAANYTRWFPIGSDELVASYTNTFILAGGFLGTALGAIAGLLHGGRGRSGKK